MRPRTIERKLRSTHHKKSKDKKAGTHQKVIVVLNMNFKENARGLSDRLSANRSIGGYCLELFGSGGGVADWRIDISDDRKQNLNLLKRLVGCVLCSSLWSGITERNKDFYADCIAQF